MSEGQDFSFEISAYVSALEFFKDKSEADGSSEAVVSLLAMARRVADGRQQLAFAWEDARRTLELSLADFRKLAAIARAIWEENYSEWYAISELMHAAAVANLGLGSRVAACEQLAAAATQVGNLDRARAATADALESLEIAALLFDGDDDRRKMVEASLKQRWKEIRERSQDSLEIFDSATGDPTWEWMNIVVWNTDRSGGEGLLAQIDATQRLAVWLRHWTGDRGKTRAEVADQMRSLLRSAVAGDVFLTARYLVTLGDALVEVEEWKGAARAFADVSSLELSGPNPLSAHARIRHAYCFLMLGKPEQCRVRLDSIEIDQLEVLADLVITVAAELARYYAVDRACRYWQGADVSPEVDEKIAGLVTRVGAIVSTTGEDDRTRYLRNMFFAVLVRDIESLRSVAR